MSKLSGDFEAVDSSHQSDMDYVSEHMRAVITLPGSGEDFLSDTSCINEMLESMPNLGWVGVVIPWFINSVNIASATIKPGVEKDDYECKDDWSVGVYSRVDAHQIHRSELDNPATVRYGGTPSDSDVISFVLALKEKGLEVAFYPFLMVDNEAKSWRGEVFGVARDVLGFYLDQYKPFIMHYAQLLHSVVDIFYLGSELERLNSVKAAGIEFPFVSCLIELAKDTKKTFW